MLCLHDFSVEVERPLGYRLDANQRMCFIPGNLVERPDPTHSGVS